MVLRFLRIIKMLNDLIRGMVTITGWMQTNWSTSSLLSIIYSKIKDVLLDVEYLVVIR